MQLELSWQPVGSIDYAPFEIEPDFKTWSWGTKDGEMSAEAINLIEWWTAKPG
jgi:hypothetical protein